MTHRHAYADLTGRPLAALERLYDALDLGREQLSPLAGFVDQLENRNGGWEERLAVDEITDLTAEIADLEAEPSLPEDAVEI